MSEWISVKDRLPDHCYRVLVSDGEKIDTAYFDIDEWLPENRIGMKINCWMPLPEPPTCRKNEENCACSDNVHEK